MKRMETKIRLLTPENDFFESDLKDKGISFIF